MITAIGTGFGDEFDIAKLRYDRVIVMTDADVDGAHIRTLDPHVPLPARCRELVERGHVYIAVPPLYQVKLGNQELYFEKESQLEELLVRERVKDMTVDRAGRARDDADRGALDAPRPRARPSSRAGRRSSTPSSGLPRDLRLAPARRDRGRDRRTPMRAALIASCRRTATS